MSLGTAGPLSISVTLALSTQNHHASYRKIKTSGSSPDLGNRLEAVQPSVALVFKKSRNIRAKVLRGRAGKECLDLPEN